MTITNGTVEYARTTRPADFESKNAKVVLSFTIEDGSDPAPVVAKVFDMAVAEVHRRLGLAPVQVPAAGVDAKVEAAKQQRAAGDRIETTRKPPAATPDPAEVVPIEPEPVPAETPAAVEGQITDKDLHTAVQIAIEKKAGNKKIVALVSEFTGTPGKSMTMIAQDRRADFLARVKALYEPQVSP